MQVTNNIFKNIILAIQHTLAMFGSTVLVPFLTGLDVGLAIMCAGIGTLIFHFCSNFKVPVFLGSSFAFISAIALILKSDGIAYVKGGIICAGMVYIIIALLVHFFGKKFLMKLFPAVVVGPIIMAIGLRLAPVALQMSGYSNNSFDLGSLGLALLAVSVIILVMFWTRSFFRYTPIIMAVIVSYVVALIMHKASLAPVIDAPYIGFSKHFMNDLLTAPKFSLHSIIAIAPIALVTTVEHIGDVKTNGEVVGKDFLSDPGLHKTLTGDGVATIVSGLLGGPAVTTYGENTGVLAITKIYNPALIRLAAVFAIMIACIGKLSALIHNIPVAVMGGVSIVLFGMIAAIGLRTLSGANLDFSHSRNLIIPACILITGIAIQEVSLGIVQVSGLFIATVLGVVLNLILPQKM
ncbi:uracil-xanthine permease family protein [Rickettsiales bacterium LUAb2]